MKEYRIMALVKTDEGRKWVLPSIGSWHKRSFKSLEDAQQYLDRAKQFHQVENHHWLYDGAVFKIQEREVTEWEDRSDEKR